MTPQNINEIYAVIEIENGKEVKIMNFLGITLASSDEGDIEYLKKRANQNIKIVNKNGKEISGLLVKFTNREVISVFGGEI